MADRKFAYTNKKQINTKKKTTKFSYTSSKQVKIHRRSKTESVKLRPLMEMVLFEQAIDKLTVFNPKTKRHIKVISALKYPKDTQAYKAALALIKKKKINIPKQLSKNAPEGEQGELFYTEPFETGDTFARSFKNALKDENANGMMYELQSTAEFLPAEQKAVRSYTGAGFKFMNEILRGYNPEVDTDRIVQAYQKLIDTDGIDPEPNSDAYYEYMERAADSVDEVLREAISDMASAFQHKEAILPEDVIVYRGISGTSAEAEALLHEFETMKPGDSFSDDGFVSTSFDEGIARKFSEDAIIEILVPKGARAIYPYAIGAEYDTEEEELILNHGCEFRIIEVVPGKSGDIKKIIPMHVKAMLIVKPDEKAK